MTAILRDRVAAVLESQCPMLQNESRREWAVQAADAVVSALGMRIVSDQVPNLFFGFVKLPQK